jgi:hypothetical protein
MTVLGINVLLFRLLLFVVFPRVPLWLVISFPRDKPDLRERLSPKCSFPQQRLAALVHALDYDSVNNNKYHISCMPGGVKAYQRFIVERRWGWWW